MCIYIEHGKASTAVIGPKAQHNWFGCRAQDKESLAQRQKRRARANASKVDLLGHWGGSSIRLAAIGLQRSFVNASKLVLKGKL